MWLLVSVHRELFYDLRGTTILEQEGSVPLGADVHEFERTFPWFAWVQAMCAS